MKFLSPSLPKKLILIIFLVGLGGISWLFAQSLSQKEKPPSPPLTTKFTLTDKRLLFTGGYADPSVIQMPNGTYLLYLNRTGDYPGPEKPGTFILSSPDGLSWETETDTIFPGVAVARAFLFPEGVRLYYHEQKGRPSYPFEPLPTHIASSFSSDGITNWQYEGPVIEPRPGYGVAGPALARLKDGTYRMAFYEDQLREGREGQILGGVIYSAKSTDGIAWIRDENPSIEYEEDMEGVGMRGPQTAQVLHPAVVEWPEKNGYLMFYNSHSRIFAAFSKDGYLWEKLENTGIHGADVDAIWMPDGSLRIYYGGGCVSSSEPGCTDPKTGKLLASTVHTGTLEIE